MEAGGAPSKTGVIAARKDPTGTGETRCVRAVITAVMTTVTTTDAIASTGAAGSFALSFRLTKSQTGVPPDEIFCSLHDLDPGWIDGMLLNAIAAARRTTQLQRRARACPGSRISSA